MNRDASAPIADIIHERLQQLDSGLSGGTVEAVALAIIAGAGRFLYETMSVTRAELEQRISQVIAGDAPTNSQKTH